MNAILALENGTWYRGEAVGAHGIIVEIHPDPAAALCDGPQALSLDMWQKLAAQLLDHEAAA